MSAVFSAHGFKTIIRLEHNIPKRWLQRDMQYRIKSNSWHFPKSHKKAKSIGVDIC